MRKVNSRELGSESGAVDYRPPETDQVIPKEEREALLAIDGVEGFGVSGVRQLCVYVRDRGVGSKLPKQIGAFEVVVQTTGIIRLQRE